MLAQSIKTPELLDAVICTHSLQYWIISWSACKMFACKMFASLQIESFDAIYFYKSDNNSLEQLRYMTRVINSETNVAAKVRL